MIENSSEQTLFDRVAFSKDERLTLLQEIGQIGLVLASANNASLHALGTDQPSVMPSPLERIALLEKALSLLSESLNALNTHPPTQKRRQVQPIALARSKGGKEALHAITHTPQGVAVWERGAGSLLETHDVIIPSQETLSHIAFLCEQIEAEVSDFLLLAEFLGAGEVAKQLQVMEREVQEIRQSPTLRILPTSHTPFSSGNTWRENTPVTALLSSACQVYESGLHWQGGTTSPLQIAGRAPWQLYEIWAYMKVVEGLLEAGWRLELGEGVRLVVRGLALELAHGKASVLHFMPPLTLPQGKRLTLWYQPYFPSANQRAGSKSTVSLTHAMQPDIGIEWQGKWWLLDAKCKPYDAPQSEQNDIDKMHTYRDAIRCAGRQVVQEAWCLFPGTPNDTRILLTSPQSTHKALFGTAGIGAILLRPKHPTALHLWLNHLIEVFG